MTPKKKPAAEIVDVNIESTAEGVKEQYAAIAFKEKMWTTALVSIVGGLFALLQVLGLAWIDSRSSTRVKNVDTKVNDISDEVTKIHKSTNSMKDALVEEVRKASFAAGRKSEKDNPEL